MSGDKGKQDTGSDAGWEITQSKKSFNEDKKWNAKSDDQVKKDIEDRKNRRANEETFKNYHKPPRPEGFINNRLNAFEQSRFAKWTNKVNRTYFSDRVLTGKNVKRNIGYTQSEFMSLSLSKQNEIYSEYMSNRMSGATDAYGNVKTGWRKDATGTFVNMDDKPVQMKTVEQIAEENQNETNTETEVKITEEEYKKRRGLTGSRSMFGNAGGRGYFDPV